MSKGIIMFGDVSLASLKGSVSCRSCANVSIEPWIIIIFFFCIYQYFYDCKISMNVMCLFQLCIK
jgi:hypothetical protein